jgi:outer membrane protein assembly factor BamB
MTAAVLIALALAAPAPKASSNSDWPQWRGPNRDGKSAETGINFPKDGPKLLWEKANVGTGYGSPAVVGNNIYLIGGSDGKAGSMETLHCYGLADGKEIWTLDLGTTPGRFSDGWGGGPRSTPTVTDGHIYALGATGDLVCATTDGKKVWSKNLVKDFAGKIPQWGYSESPLVDDGRVVVTPGSGTGMLALDAKTGKTAWECKEFKDSAGYSSIMPMMLGDKKLYIQQTMEHALGVFAKDGKLAFSTGEIKRRTAVIPTPVISGDHVFFTAGYGAGCECYKLSLNGDKVKAERVFSNNAITNHHGGVIGLGDYVFGHSDGGGGWTMLNMKSKDADIAWKSTKLGKGSVTFADGLFFCYAESSGELAVVKAAPDAKEWVEVGRMKLPSKSTTRPNNGKVWPHPVIAQGKLFLRDYDKFFVFDLKAN